MFKETTYLKFSERLYLVGSIGLLERHLLGQCTKGLRGGFRVAPSTEWSDHNG
jgi:hypothetical protein